MEFELLTFKNDPEYIENDSCNSDSALKCEVCSEILASKKYLAVHMKIHAEEQSEKLCQESDKKFTNDLSVRDAKEIKIEISEEDTVINYGEIHNNFTDEMSEVTEFKTQKVKSEQCDYEIKSEPFSDIERDGIKEEELSSGAFEFIKCEEEPSASTDSPLTKDISKPLHKCELCNKSVTTKRSLAQHMRRHTGEKPHECDFCGRKFTEKQDLRKHIRLHAGEKRYKCDICEKLLTTKDNLRSHRLLHSGAQPHKCDICEKKFLRKHNLEKHIRSHLGEKPYQCEFCDGKFLQKSDLTKHARLHTGEKPYKCEVCEKSFARKDHLTMHVRGLHTKEKQFKCEFCDKSFSWNTILVEHRKLHTGEKPFKCDFCDKQFRRKQRLKEHLRLHVNEQS